MYSCSRRFDKGNDNKEKQNGTLHLNGAPEHTGPKTCPSRQAVSRCAPSEEKGRSILIRRRGWIRDTNYIGPLVRREARRQAMLKVILIVAFLTVVAAGEMVSAITYEVTKWKSKLDSHS